MGDLTTVSERELRGSTLKKLLQITVRREIRGYNIRGRKLYAIFQFAKSMPLLLEPFSRINLFITK